MVVLGDLVVLAKEVLAKEVLAWVAHGFQMIQQVPLPRFLQADFRVLLSRRLLVEGFALVVLMAALMVAQKVALMVALMVALKAVQMGAHFQVLGWVVHVLEDLVKGAPGRVAGTIVVGAVTAKTQSLHSPIHQG